MFNVVELRRPESALIVLPVETADLEGAEKRAVESLRDRLEKIFGDCGIAPELGQALGQSIYSARGTTAEATIDAYIGDIRKLVPILKANGQTVLPMRAGVVAGYLDAMAKESRPTTLDRYKSAIAWLHRMAGLPSPTVLPVVRDALKRHRKTVGIRGRRRAEPIRAKDTARMIEAAVSDRLSLRDRLLLLLAHDTGRRASELVILQLEDVMEAEKGRGIVLLRRSKSDQLGEGKLLPLSRLTMATIAAWKAETGLDSGPILRSFELDGQTLREPVPTSKGPRGMTRQSIGAVIKRHAALANLGPGISAHSTRVGFAQNLRAKRVPHLDAMLAGGWKSLKQYMSYAEEIDAMESAAVQIFLDEGIDARP